MDKSLTSTLYEGKVLTDFSKLSGSEFTVYARLLDSTGLEISKKTEGSVVKITESGNIKIIN